MINRLLNQVSNSPSILLNDELRLENAARKLCELRSINPDGLSELIVIESGQTVIQPRWKAYAREIKTFLQVQIAIDSLK